MNNCHAGGVVTGLARKRMPRATSVEGAGGAAGTSQSTHHAPPVWRAPVGPQGLAGLRADAPSEARGADGERAGGPDGARNTGGAAATWVCERPGGGTPPPGLYARLTFP